MTHWIVDGMNVIGSRPTGWWRDRPGAMRALAADLEAFAQSTAQPVTVVFDGRPFELQGDALAVKFASHPGPNAADDDIAALVERAPRPDELTVVTSDATLADRVRARGAGVMGARTFRRRLEGGAEDAG